MLEKIDVLKFSKHIQKTSAKFNNILNNFGYYITGNIQLIESSLDMYNALIKNDIKYVKRHLDEYLSFFYTFYDVECQTVRRLENMDTINFRGIAEIFNLYIVNNEKNSPPENIQKYDDKFWKDYDKDIKMMWRYSLT